MMAIATFIYLLMVDVRLAILALLLWLLLDMFLNRGRIYSGGKALFHTRRALFVSFSLEPDRKKSIISLSRGIKIVRGDVEPTKLVELAINVSRHVARHHGRRKFRARARVIDYIVPKNRYFKIAIPATLRKSAASDHFPDIRPEDLRANLYSGKGKVSLIVVLDSSASMMYSIRGILTAFKAIKREARKYRDRVGLIVSKGFGSAIAQYPTTNFNLVLSKFSTIGLDDFTPLASGMYRGYDLALRERRKGYEPVMIIVSDGNVNVPLERHLRKGWLSSDPAVQSVLEVAQLISKAGIETIVINTKHREIFYESSGSLISGTELLLRVSRITRGTYVGVTG